jgi:hypothetical protein
MASSAIATRWQIMAMSFPAAIAREIVSANPDSLMIAPISRSSVIIRPSNRRSSLRSLVITLAESEAGSFSGSNALYQACPIIMLLTWFPNARKIANSQSSSSARDRSILGKS